MGKRDEMTILDMLTKAEIMFCVLPWKSAQVFKRTKGNSHATGITLFVIFITNKFIFHI